jgi:hypothetical protein
VLGLGDVYLGAPVATPVDPRHRLVTTKYNPRAPGRRPTWSASAGPICASTGMEGPGGYQLFGRTIQVWNTHRETDAFEAGKPWLLRFFDQIRFFKVSAEELADWRRISPAGAGPSRSRNRSSASPTTARSCATTPIRSPFEAQAGGLRCGTRRMAAHRRVRPGDRPDRSDSGAPPSPSRCPMAPT